ncbi:fused response regulator/phosphatase [Gammaproteobacteria bacterium]|nr:fused response regulator/phosphatase [Gammaproteobacteria bacterium]
MNIDESSTILVIGDDNVVRQSIASYLSQQDYRVVLAATSEEGIDCFHSSCPNLVVLDINLSSQDGFTLLQEIFSEVPDQPVIVLADMGNTDDVVKAMRLGVSDYLIKPIKDMAMLGLSIGNSLKRARLIEEKNSYRKKLELTNQELETRLEVFKLDQQAGRHVQISMLPVPGQTICDYHFDHKVIPSLFLSGDSVDYKPVSKDKVLFYIGDVSGHGSSSAFITVLLRFRIEQMRREYIRGRFSGDFSPAVILKALNEDLLDSGLDKHITLFLGLLDRKNNSLRYSVAGHYPLPIVYDNGKVNFIPVKKSSFPLGLFDKAEYFEEEIAMSNDFSLTLFSDGILEILKMEKLDDKEEYLLKTVLENKGDFDKIKATLHLDDNTLVKVPDDIAVMSMRSS